MPMDRFPLTQQVRGQIGMTILLTTAVSTDADCATLCQPTSVLTGSSSEYQHSHSAGEGTEALGGRVTRPRSRS